MTVEFSGSRSPSYPVVQADREIVRSGDELLLSSTYVEGGQLQEIIAYDQDWTGAHCILPGLPEGSYTAHHGDLELALILPSTQEYCAHRHP